MEDVLGVYHRPLDLDRPVICLDEVPVQLVEEVRAPLPPRPGRRGRYDSEYQRCGTANLFLAFAPLLGWRSVSVTDRRTRADFAAFLRWVVDDCFPRAKRVVLVTDNLSIHTPGSLYEAFEPPVARGCVSGWSGTTPRGTGRG
jgi:hypothetical protein